MTALLFGFLIAVVFFFMGGMSGIYLVWKYILASKMTFNQLLDKIVENISK